MTLLPQRAGTALLYVAVATLIWSCAIRLDKDKSQPIINADSGFSMIGELDFRLLPEASGLSISGIDRNILWWVNDQGNPSSLVVVDTQTMQFKSIVVHGAENRDWEDMSAFSAGGKSWLMIADVGDNNAVRDEVSLIFVPEPAAINVQKTAPAVTANLRFPDGARDVEAVAVDSTDDGIYLLSKRTTPPVLYRLSLSDAMNAARASQTETLVAQRLGEVTSIPAPTAMELKLFPKFGRYRGQPTAMDFSPDARIITLLTYGEAYVAYRAPGQSVLDALNENLRPLQMPVLAQPETIAIDSNGFVYVSSERRDAPLLKRQLRIEQER